MPKPTDIRIATLSIMLVLTSIVSAQTVLQPWEVPCDHEKVQANFELGRSVHVSGELKDASGAPFARSQVELRALSSGGMFIGYKRTTTDKDGHFDLDVVNAGKYRFLPSPSRAFKQPDKVDCFDNEPCALKLVLRANATDQEFSNCPIQ